MKEIKVISFDLDGTLTDSSFVDSVWLKEIPKAYAIKNKISIEKAKREVLENYSKIGNEKLEWYDIVFWLDSFNLDIKPEVLLNSNKDKIQLFEDVPFILKKLSGSKKRLIVISNARREFLDLEITQTGIGNFFEHVFSATSDFNLTKNTSKIFLKICKICKISPSEMIHIGDDYRFDFKVPHEIGINAIFLDREGKEKRKYAVKSLKDLSIK
jgi:putative hydrolase of the HAD superfamily